MDHIKPAWLCFRYLSRRQRSLNSEGFLCRVVAHLDRRSAVAPADAASQAVFVELLRLIRFRRSHFKQGQVFAWPARSSLMRE